VLVGVLRVPGPPAFEDMGPLARSVASAVALLAVMVVPDASAAATAARSNGAHVKGIGESSIATTAAAMGNALYAALRVQIHDLPIRAGRVFRAMRGAATRHAR
jgi:CO/xanthine dehydrogenase Mo-binding subunit